MIYFNLSWFFYNFLFYSLFYSQFYSPFFIANAHKFTVCSPKDNLGVENLLVSPDEPIPGHVLSVKISGNSLINIGSGELLVDVKVFGVKVKEMSLDICSYVHCPINGKYSFEFSQELPLETPEAVSVNIMMSVVVNNTIVSCVDTIIKTSRKNFYTEVIQVYNMWKREWKNKEDLKKNLKREERIEWKTEKAMNFLNNYLRVLNHNSMGPRTKTFEMSLNEFAEDSLSVFSQSRFCKSRDEFTCVVNTPPNTLPNTPNILSNVPLEIDYSKNGSVTPVKNQGSCGSCWAFAAVASVESAYFLKYKKLKTFSEQQVVSCDIVDKGCRGGLQDTAFKFIEKNGGLCTDKEYKYDSGNGADGVCITGCNKDPNTIPKNIIDIEPSEDALTEALLKHGPVVVDIEADQASFQFYKSGVISKWCGSKLDHAVLLVGYGRDNATGLDYWKLKNSWGPKWGENGYVRIERHKKFRKTGMCGIASSASFPVL
jgi:KDEL-tailed cysteine endopeptidase